MTKYFHDCQFNLQMPIVVIFRDIDVVLKIKKCVDIKELKYEKCISLFIHLFLLVGG